MNIPDGSGMSDELRNLIEKARNYKMTPEEKFEQRVSFVYGQQDWSAPTQRTKDEIRAAIIELEGRAPASAGSAKRQDTAGGLIAEGDNIAVGRQADAPNTLVTPSLLSDSREAIETNQTHLAARPALGGELPSDVRRLVIAARVFWDELNGPFPESDDLLAALEVFASRVPFEGEPA